MDQFPRAWYHHWNLQLRTIRSRKALILTTERLMSTLLLPSNSSLAPCTSTTHITAKSLGDHGRAGQFKFGLHDAVLLSNGRLRCKHYRTKGILNVIICACVDITLQQPCQGGGPTGVWHFKFQISRGLLCSQGRRERPRHPHILIFIAINRVGNTEMRLDP